jgi:hypothetical protein
MGRYYYGDISGKFWFGVQASNDADHFDGVHEKVEMYYYECEGCGEETDKEDEKPDEPNYICKCGCETWTLETEGAEEVSYTFDESHVEFIGKTLNDLESKIPEFDITIDEDDDYSYSFSDEDWVKIQKLDKSVQELVARWCLGKQLESYLDTFDTCTFRCER